MNKLKLIFPFLLLLLILSCDDNALFNAGKTVTREIILPDSFADIEVKKLFDIELVNDTINKVFVTCGENLQKDIHITIQNNILYLDENIDYKWSRNYDKIKLKLHLRSASYINVRKPCRIFTRDTFKTGNFILVDWGKFVDLDVCLDVYNLNIQVSSDDYGRYKLRGKATYADFRGRGSIFIYAHSMLIQNCTVYHTGIGDIYLNVEQTLTARIESTGNIYYKGNPVITIEKQTSSGRLINVD